MKRMLTVTIDRAENSNKLKAKAEIEKVLEVLKPLNVRVRVTRAPSTLKEDKVWR
jgi:hypothetical protein